MSDESKELRTLRARCEALEERLRHRNNLARRLMRAEQENRMLREGGEAILKAYDEACPTDPGDGTVGSQYEAEEIMVIDRAIEAFRALLEQTGGEKE